MNLRLLTRTATYPLFDLSVPRSPRQTNYWHNDHLSPRVRTTTSGSIADQRGTYPYGETWYSPASATYIFSTYYRDSESGNDYAQLRYDATRFGRFLLPDPVPGSINDPQSLNRYAYVLNDPCSLQDPWGARCTLSFGLNGQTLGSFERDRIRDVFDQAGVDIKFVSSGKADFYMWQNVPLQPPPNTDGTVWGTAQVGIALINNNAIINKSVSINGNTTHGYILAETAVGTVISHELGHLILKCGHLPAGNPASCGNTGLMRPGTELGDGQFLDPKIGGFQDYAFTREQGQAIRDRCRRLRTFDSGHPKPHSGGSGGGGTSGVDMGQSNTNDQSGLPDQGGGGVSVICSYIGPIPVGCTIKPVY